MALTIFFKAHNEESGECPRFFVKKNGLSMHANLMNDRRSKGFHGRGDTCFFAFDQVPNIRSFSYHPNIDLNQVHTCNWKENLISIKNAPNR